jgi:cytidylate kinase
MAIITISRKFGSFGDDIARKVAKQTGLRVIERADIHQLALKCDEELANTCRRFETEMPAGFFERIFLGDPAGASTFASLIYQEAAQGDVMILGRGSQIVLAKQPRVLKVRVVAPLEVRVERISKRNSITIDEATEYIEHHDRQRRSLIESIFHVDLSDWSLYDMMLNSADLQPDLLAQMICVVAEKLGPTSVEQKTAFANLALAKRVEALIKKKVPTFWAYALNVENLGQGRLVLTGAMNSLASIELAVRIANATEGVKEVDNQVRFIDLTME